MIKLNKLNEPKILSDNYQVWTDELILLQAKEQLSGKKISKHLKTKYNHKEIKDQLKKETFKKCAYCESKFLSTSFGDIEHVVPKTFKVEMWFKWTNLTLACQVCNNNKSDYYSTTDPLLDPYVDEIDEHIFFGGSMLFSKSLKGALTIRKLDLNRIDLIEARNWYLKNTIDPFIQLINVQSDPDLRESVFRDMYELTKEINTFSKMALSIITQFSTPIKSA